MYREYDYVFKLVIVGRSSVGKSSILKRFADNDYHENYISTIGVDFRFKSLVVNDKNVKMQIWDTAGQERFRGLASTYYKGAHGVLLVYDITNSDSFNDIQNYWLKEVSHIKGPMDSDNFRYSQLSEHMEHRNNIYVLINKCDSPDTPVQPEQLAFLKEHNVKYFQVSAKTGRNVHETIELMTKHLVQTMPPNQKKDDSITISNTQRERMIRGKKCCGD